MALPKLNTPKYKMKLPSDGRVVNFRPFLVKEEKLLLVATETGGQEGLFEAIKTIIADCTDIDDVEALANRIGIPAISKVDVVSDADTGLSMMGITYQDAGTFDVYTTLTWIYGIVAGAQGGTDDTLTDKGGLRLATTAQSSGAFTNAVS